MTSRPSGNRLAAHIFLVLLCLILLIPFYIVIVNSFKNNADILTSPMSIPLARLSMDNYVKAFTNPNFNVAKAYFTTTWITVISGLFVIFFSSMMAYIIARNPNKWTKGVYWVFLCGLMFPPSVVLIPVVKVIAEVGLLHSPQGLILYNVGAYMPFCLFIYTGFIRTISKSLDESAKIDGAGTFVIFWRILFPLIRPATATLIIFIFLWIWNDFLNPNIILGPASGSYTITTGLFTAIGKYNTNWNQVFAYIVLGFLPILILYVFMQRHFINGLTEGALKG